MPWKVCYCSIFFELLESGGFMAAEFYALSPPVSNLSNLVLRTPMNNLQHGSRHVRLPSASDRGLSTLCSHFTATNHHITYLILFIAFKTPRKHLQPRSPTSNCSGHQWLSWLVLQG